MSYYLFLDDIRNPSDVLWAELPRDQAYDIVRDYHEFVSHIMRNGVPSFVAFDHDLGDEYYEEDNDNVLELSGYDCAKWLVEYCDEIGRMFPKYIVHSMNPIGRERIDAYIVNARKHLNI